MKFKKRRFEHSPLALLQKQRWTYWTKRFPIKTDVVLQLTKHSLTKTDVLVLLTKHSPDKQTCS